MRINQRWKQLGVSAIVYVGAVVVLAGIASAVFFGAKSYIDGVDSKAFERGRTEAVAAYQKRDNEALAAANKRIAELGIQIRAIEAKAAKDVAALDANHQKEIERAKNQAEHDVNAARSGALRLRDHWRDEARSCIAARDRDAVSAAAGTTGVGNGPRGAELSAEATEFLLTEANRADAVVDKLTAAQALIRKYVEVCNGN